MRSCSTASPMPGASWRSGARTTTTSDRTHPWGTRRRHKRAGRSCKIESSHPARLCRRACTNIKPADSRYDRGISGRQVTDLSGCSHCDRQRGRHRCDHTASQPSCATSSCPRKWPNGTRHPRRHPPIASATATRVTAIRAQTQRKRLDRSAHRAEKRRCRARMLQVHRMIRRAPNIWATTDTAQGEKCLFNQQNQATLTTDGRPLGECRLLPAYPCHSPVIAYMIRPFNREFRRKNDYTYGLPRLSTSCHPNAARQGCSVLQAMVPRQRDHVAVDINLGKN